MTWKLTLEIWEETHLREIFYGSLIFQQSSMICIGCHIGGHTLALQHGGQNCFLLVSCKSLNSYAQMCCKRYHIIFSTMSLKFKCKIFVQKKVIRSFENYILVTWSTTELTHFKKMVRVWKTKSLLFWFKIWPTNFFWRRNHITFIFIKMMSHDLLVQMAHLNPFLNVMRKQKMQWRRNLNSDFPCYRKTVGTKV